MNNENTIAIETTEGDIVAPQDGIEIVNSWNESGIDE